MEFDIVDNDQELGALLRTLSDINTTLTLVVKELNEIKHEMREARIGTRTSGPTFRSSDISRER